MSAPPRWPYICRPACLLFLCNNGRFMMFQHAIASVSARPHCLILFFFASICMLSTLFLALNDRDRFFNILANSRYPGKTPVLQNITRTAAILAESPIKAPYKDWFWDSAQRTKLVGQWLNQLDREAEGSRDRDVLQSAIEQASASLFPFLQWRNGGPGKTPMLDLVNRADKGSRGMVIVVGGKEQLIRFAGHLIVSLREVLHSQLPIQIAYAGDDDLPKHYRDALASLDHTNNTSFLDVWTVFRDQQLQLRENGWAIKPFAALASQFEQIVIVDSDVVFLQDPNSLFSQPAFTTTGAYLFHDRLLWQHRFQDRHEWWKNQIKKPSPALNRSLVWTQDYAEECDSGVVILDKSRRDIFTGLLHTAWQNMHDVRKEVTYKLTYGDKESWWLGLELVGAAYEFEEHYGSMLGWESAPRDGQEPTNRVCSFVIAHLDQKGKLIWYNGSLLKNKLTHPDKYQAPDAWMVDGIWEKGRSKQDMSCMHGAEVRKLTEKEQLVLQRSIEMAMRADSVIKEAKP